MLIRVTYRRRHGQWSQLSQNTHFSSHSRTPAVITVAMCYRQARTKVDSGGRAASAFVARRQTSDTLLQNNHVLAIRAEQRPADLPAIRAKRLEIRCHQLSATRVYDQHLT